MILMKDIIKEGHKTLVTVAKEVVLPLSKADIKLAYDLMEYVQNSQDAELSEKYGLRPGVGIAAPQVNVSKRMFAMHCEDFDGTLHSYLMINPVILATSKEITYLPAGEGCLSVDRETEGLTPRYLAIQASGFYFDFSDNTAKPIELELFGYPAIVFQHEFDHLNGIMYTTKLFPSLPNAEPLFSIDDETSTDES